MVTAYSLIVVKWKEVAGPPRAVRLEYSKPYTTWAPEGSSLSETQTILNYISEQPANKQDELTKAAKEGLLTLAIMGEVRAPTFPPCLQRSGSNALSRLNSSGVRPAPATISPNGPGPGQIGPSKTKLIQKLLGFAWFYSTIITLTNVTPWIVLRSVTGRQKESLYSPEMVSAGLNEIACSSDGTVSLRPDVLTDVYIAMVRARARRSRGGNRAAEGGPCV